MCLLQCSKGEANLYGHLILNGSTKGDCVLRDALRLPVENSFDCKTRQAAHSAYSVLVLLCLVLVLENKIGSGTLGRRRTVGIGAVGVLAVVRGIWLDDAINHLSVMDSWRKDLRRDHIQPEDFEIHGYVSTYTH